MLCIVNLPKQKKMRELAGLKALSGIFRVRKVGGGKGKEKAGEKVKTYKWAPTVSLLVM